MINLFKVFMAPNTHESVKKVLESGFVGQGPKVEEWEGILRNHFQNNFINTTNSATSGLHLALNCIKINDPSEVRNEVLTIPLTCTATNTIIVHNNLKIKWVDTDLETCNVDLVDLERKLSHRTKAIMVVHWGGTPVDIDQLKIIADKCHELYGHKPPIIEDCAHCWDSFYKDKMVGTHGNYCVFSQQAIKFLNSGDGGFIISPDEKTHKINKLTRWFGLDRDSSASFRCAQNIQYAGFKAHMNDIAAAIAVCNYEHASNLVAKHKKNAAYFNDNLKNIQGIRLIENKYDSSYWIYTLFVENRNGFMQKLKEKGIETSQVHRRNDLHDCFKQFKTSLPNTEIVDKTQCCIPCGWWLTPEDCEYIVDTIKAGW